MKSKMNPKLKEKIMESVSAVLPITIIVLLISIVMIPMDLGGVCMFVTGSLLLIVGMGFFQLGSEMAMTPIGEGIGVTLSHTRSAFLLGLVGLVMGIIITVSEPDLAVLASQVPAVPNLVLILTVAVGVGFFLAVAVLRIRYRVSLPLLLTLSYVLLIAVSFFVPGDFLAVAFDSGGVTTGPMTVPFIMAMGVGLASVRADKNASSDAFGLVALSSIGPILAVLLLGLFFHPEDANYTLDTIPAVENTMDVAAAFLHGIGEYAKEVVLSLLPIAVVFVIFQLMSRRFHPRQLLRIIMGLLFTFVGLVLFLCGVNVGFSPIGAHLGEELASLEYKWILVPLGMLIGYFIVAAEPAGHVLTKQVEEVTSGTIPEKLLSTTLSIGVAVSVGISMLRVLIGIPILYILIPGYAIALLLSFVVPDIFTSIAFDSGGVASGPMTATFLLPFAVGACSAVGGNLVEDAFALVSMVAMTPLITIQILGLIYQIKQKKQASSITEDIETADVISEEAAHGKVLPEDDIIDL